MFGQLAGAGASAGVPPQPQAACSQPATAFSLALPVVSAAPTAAGYEFATLQGLIQASGPPLQSHLQQHPQPPPQQQRRHHVISAPLAVRSFGYLPLAAAAEALTAAGGGAVAVTGFRAFKRGLPSGSGELRRGSGGSSDGSADSVHLKRQRT